MAKQYTIRKPDRGPISVTQLNRNVRQLLEQAYGQVHLWGEISNFKPAASGHWYFTLKDRDSEINAACFRRAASRVGFKPKDGMEVEVRASVTVYEPRGRYQIIVEEMTPRGEGVLQQAFEKMKKKLHEEGLFDAEHKQEIPYLPKAVGIVTSPTGAAVKDIMNVIGRRFPSMPIYLYPARVQGEGAAAEVIRGIECFNKLGNVDVMIVGRGGGSLEDLWAFNEEKLARAVFKSKVPVISAVGHEVDTTICDYVADRRALTPSEAGELAVPVANDLIEGIQTAGDRLRIGLERKLERYRGSLDQLREHHIFRRPLLLIDQASQQLDDLSQQMARSLGLRIERNQRTLEHLEEQLAVLSPLAILERGYSITYGKDGKILRKATKAKTGDTLTTRLHDGTLESEVK